MVENVADDGVDRKLAIIDASGDVKPTVNVKLTVKIPFQLLILSFIWFYSHTFNTIIFCEGNHV